MIPLSERDPEPSTVPGRNEHALAVANNRHPGVRDALLWLTFNHLPESLQRYSRPFYLTAVELIGSIDDSPELTTSLNLLIQARDSAVRAGIRSENGRAGSVPRPDTVINPPLNTSPDVRAQPL